MNRVMLDTSVYGKLLTDSDTVRKIASLVPRNIVVYGAKIIRTELRDTPAHIKERNKSRRILLLSLYDSLVGKHELRFNRLLDTLAQDYYLEYRNFGGGLSYDAIGNDFVIVATATLHHLDIVVSHDRKSMLGKSAMKAYRKINSEYGLESPKLITYVKFCKNLRSGNY